jgi:hypothetical protein
MEKSRISLLIIEERLIDDPYKVSHSQSGDNYISTANHLSFYLDNTHFDQDISTISVLRWHKTINY